MVGKYFVVCAAALSGIPWVPVADAQQGGWRDDAPGKAHEVRASDLPKPDPEDSVRNNPRVVARPDGATPKVPEGFEIREFATDLENPRYLEFAPNGDLLVTESKPGRILVFRDADSDGTPETRETFIDGLNKPFGLAFYPPGSEPKYLYIANTDGIVRVPYRSGDLKAQGQTEHIADLSAGGQLTGGGHWTRDIVFSQDGKSLYASIGSLTNVNEEDNPVEKERARIFRFRPDGAEREVFATGIRNPVGLAIHPLTGELWTSVNERDGLGDDLVPDYITSVKEGGFYGWPWFYIGPNVDPRHESDHPDNASDVIVPDVLVTSHSASLCMAFYDGNSFPEEYRGDAFAAFHGSWNREPRTGYKVVRVPLEDGKAKGGYEDFVTGFVTDDGKVWGRPVGVAVGPDGALFMCDDGSNTIWRVQTTD